ncbi:MAG TPA: hypothetical protein DEH25_15540, partial [Chloroflexi bacterium]|nr:hypothetical protein [Chloroflexota bacterium]
MSTLQQVQCADKTMIYKDSKTEPKEKEKQKMKKHWLILIALILTFSLLLAACGGNGNDTDDMAAPAEEAAAPSGEIQPASKIVMYNWSEYIDPEIYTLFQDEFGIQIVEDNFSNNEELLAKLQGGAAGYALVVPSDYTVSIMITEGMLAKLDRNNVPNLANLSDQFQNVPYDPGNVYCVPYDWGTTGIGYLDGQVEEPTSWAVLFDPDPNAVT